MQRRRRKYRAFLWNREYLRENFKFYDSFKFDAILWEILNNLKTFDLSLEYMKNKLDLFEKINSKDDILIQAEKKTKIGNDAIINRVKKYENIFDQFNQRKKAEIWINIKCSL